MIRVNLASRNPCPTCGGDAEEGFDGGSDTLYEWCDRETDVLRGPLLRAWWAEHARHCAGCDGRDGPPMWRCRFYCAPPRWLQRLLRADREWSAPIVLSERG